MTVRLLVLRSLWTNGYDLAAALADVDAGDFDGIEGPVPTEKGARRDFSHRIAAAGVPFVAELVTGGDYVPRERAPAKHLEEFVAGLERSGEAGPRSVTVLAGCDQWPSAVAIDFYGAALEIAEDAGLRISFETHRSRPTFNPWATAEILRQVPALRLTSDFSHWCCVCERLVLDEEPELLGLFAGRTDHIHARIGYAQGPQVPHPAAPEFHAAVAAHERWWDAIAEAHEAAGASELTFTPEFGPDGYLQCAPFTQSPLADLNEVNRQMARRLKRRYGTITDELVRGGK